MADAYEHGQMTVLKMDARKHQEELLEVEEQHKVWMKRFKLAKKHNREDLIQEAGEKLTELKAAWEHHTTKLEHIKQHMSLLRQQANRPEDQGELDRANQVLENFAAIGVRPEDQELREVQREVAAEDMLAQLKAKMKKGS